MPHSDPAEPTTRSTARLQEILAEEIAVCESLLEAGQAARQAFADIDPQAVQTSVQLRQEQMVRLEALEQEASALRAQVPAAPLSLQPDTSRLRALTQAIAVGEAALHRLSGASLTQLREQLKGFQAGSKGLRGYRGSVTVAPRFSDRRG